MKATAKLGVLSGWVVSLLASAAPVTGMDYPVSNDSAQSLDSSECVILLHGLARSDRSMNKLSRQLTTAGYKVVNVDYPSTEQTIEALANSVIPAALQQCPAKSPVHFVTHSMGGLLVRQYMHEAGDSARQRVSRVVMLGPPNQGSEVTDKLGSWSIYQRINGPAGDQLGTGADNLPMRLGPVDFELGVIAGSRTVNPILSTMLPNPDDGKVSVANTKVAGMADHLVLPVSHTFMMRDKRVIQQVLSFLEMGHFDTSEAISRAEIKKIDHQTAEK